MDFNTKLQIFRSKIKANKSHIDYKRTVDLAKEYKAHISGEGLDDYLKQFNLREDDQMFQQRKRLTNAISKPVASSIKKPFYKVSRNKNVRIEFDLKEETKNNVIRTMMANFYGSKELNVRGLDFWLKNRFLELVFSDPNTYIVIEWKPMPLDKAFEPYPFEVKSEHVFDIQKENGNLISLTTKMKQNQFFLEGDKEITKEVDAWTFYEIGSSLKIIEVDKKFLELKEIKIQENQILFEEEEKTFLATYNNSNLDFIPAFCVGYLRDEATDGRTYVSPLDSAMPYFRKSLKAVSELDLSITLHTFPQKIQFVSACKYRVGNNRCQEGRLSQTKETCPNCKGSGLEIHKSGQDAILHKLPEDKSELFDLDKTLIYKTPPIDLIKFQDDYVRNLKQDAHLAIFNSTMYLISDPQFAKTATEIDFNAEGIQDTLFPYTEKFSEIWKTVVKTFVRLSGFNQEFDMKHIFPADLKLKTTAMLLAEMKNANESEAPSFLIDQITSEIAGQIYNGDPLAMKKFETRHKFFPFNGKSKEEISLLLASPYVSEWTKILYANFEAIFTDIEKDNPNFYVKPYTQQWEILTEATKPYEEEIKKQTQPQDFRFNFGTEAGNQTEE